MQTKTLTCRVCGKEYQGCKNANTHGAFRWQEVACSPECGEVYLKRVQESRKEVAPVTKQVKKPATKKATPAIEDKAADLPEADKHES